LRLICRSGQSLHLEIEQRENEGIVILDLKGRLVLGLEDIALRQRLQGVHEGGHLNAALNLKEVSEIDTTALGTLVFCATKFRETRGRLVLFNLSAKHSELSNMVKLNSAFEIYPDEVAAVNSFFPDRAVRHYDILEFVEDLEQKRHGDDVETGKNR
jgi:anti-sigma B factor antagonist